MDTEILLWCNHNKFGGSLFEQHIFKEHAADSIFFVDKQTSCTHYLFLNWEFGNFQFKLNHPIIKEEKKKHTKTSNIRMFLQYMHQQTVDSQITYIWSVSYLY